MEWFEELRMMKKLNQDVKGRNINSIFEKDVNDKTKEIKMNSYVKELAGRKAIDKRVVVDNSLKDNQILLVEERGSFITVEKLKHF